jgi:hypothetical protein
VAEVYIDEGADRGLWLPVDPTLNEFPADATHVRLARGGLDKQASILPLIGRLKMRVLDLQLDENATRVHRRPLGLLVHCRSARETVNRGLLLAEPVAEAESTPRS